MIVKMLCTVDEKESRELDHGHRFYQRIAELQEKLRKSEEERLKLEENFKILMRSCREEEDAKLTMLKAKYEKFLDEEKKRRERNDRILQTLDRIESRTVMLTSKSERLQLMRRHYEAYLSSMYPAWTDNHQGQSAKSKMSPVKPNSRYDNRTSDINKDSHFPLTPVKGSVYTPSYLPNHTVHQRVPMGYSSIHPLGNTLGLSQQSPHQEYSLSGHHLTPSQTPSYQQFSPFHQMIPNSLSSIPKPLTSQYTRGVPTFSSRDVKHQELFQSSPPEKLNPYSHHTSATQNSSQDLFQNPLLSDSLKFRGKHTTPSIAITVDENQQIMQSDESPHKKSILSDCISNAAELLNYKVRGDHVIEESKLATSLENELEQNTSGDPLCMSLSDDGILNQEEDLNNEALFETTPRRKQVSNHVDSNTFGISPVCKDITVENPAPILDTEMVANVKQNVECVTPVVIGQNLNTLYEQEAETIGDTKTNPSGHDLTNMNCRPANGVNVKVKQSEYGQGDATDVVKHDVSQEAEYDLSNINNKNDVISDALPKEHISEPLYPENKVGKPESLGTEDYSVGKDPQDVPNNGTINHDNFIGGEELNSNTENNACETSFQYKELQENSANVVNIMNDQTGDVYEEQREYGANSGEGYVEDGQATITGQAYEGLHQEYGVDNLQGYVEGEQAEESNYETGQAYVHQRQQEYAADNAQGYVEYEQGNENSYVTEQTFDEQLQQEYVPDEGQACMEDGQAIENNYAVGQVYDEQLQQEYAAHDGQGYIEGGQANENNYVVGQVYDEQQQEYAADDGQGYVEDSQANENNYAVGQTYDEQQQEYAADDGQGYVEDGQSNEYNYAVGQSYDEQLQQEYAAEGQDYLEDVQATGNYVTGQAYEEEHGTGRVASDDHAEGQYISEETPLEVGGVGYTEPGDHHDIGASLDDKHKIDQGDPQYFQGGKYHEPTVGYETGSISNSEENVHENAPGEIGVSNESLRGSFHKLSAAEKEDSPGGALNTMAEQLTEFQPEQDSKLLEQSKESRDILDNSENNTSISSSEFTKQNDSNELESDINPTKVSIEGDGPRVNVFDRNPSKPKTAGLAMLESDSDSAVLDTVGMPNDDSDFDFSENK